MSKILTLEEIAKFSAAKFSHKAFSFKYLSQQGKNLPPIKKLWGYFIPESSLIHFASKRGVGKSFLAMEICLAISNRWESFLGEDIELHGPTLYLDFEMNEKTLKRRAYKLDKNAPSKIGRYADEFTIFSTRKSFIEEYETIAKYIWQIKPVLIVIDNLRSAISNLDTNSATDMGLLFKTLNALKDIHNCSIVIIDHFRKHTNNQLSDSDLHSGSGAKSDLSDGDFMLRNSSQGNELRLLKRIKSRLAPESDNCKLLKFNSETLWLELLDDNVNESEHIGIKDLKNNDEQKDIANDLRNQGKTFDEIAVILGKGKTTIHRWLKNHGE